MGKGFNFSVILFLTLLVFPPLTYSQIIRSTGNPTESSSQLVYFYDVHQTENTFQTTSQNTVIHVTNTNDTMGTFIHVQVFRSTDPDDDATTPNNIICDERNFVDFLTPNDTHVYDLPSVTFFPKNKGEDEFAQGESTSINLNEPNGTTGFIVITPVVSEADLSAISFEFLIGTTMNDFGSDFRMNAMGRSAVDFATGEVVETGTPLDGTTNGFILIQPEELIFDFAGDEEDVNLRVDVVGFAFMDVYGDPGLQGYAVAPGDATWTSFIFDYKEDATSCGVRNIGCFLTLGLNDTYTQFNKLFTQEGMTTEDDTDTDDLLCAGSVSPSFVDDLDPTPNFRGDFANFGWVRLFVSGIVGRENHFGVFFESPTGYSGARWMSSNEAVPPE